MTGEMLNTRARKQAMRSRTSLGRRFTTVIWLQILLEGCNRAFCYDYLNTILDVVPDLSSGLGAPPFLQSRVRRASTVGRCTRWCVPGLPRFLGYLHEFALQTAHLRRLG